MNVRRDLAAPGIDRVAAYVAQLDERAEEDARRRRILTQAVLAALALHLAIAFLVPRPEPAPIVEEVVREVIRLTQTPRFAPPPPKPVEHRAPTRRVPVPDPTPEEPEPIRAVEPALQPIVIEPDLAGIPEAPPPPEPVIRFVSGEVVAPAKLFAPDPAYPEIARRIRKQGVVVLQLRLAADGTVESIEPLTALGFGLEESAVAAVSKWRFGPATLRGEPIPVLYNLSIRFSLAN